MGVDAGIRAAAAVWVLVLAVLALTISPFLAAGVVGGATAALIEHRFSRR